MSLRLFLSTRLSLIVTALLLVAGPAVARETPPLPVQLDRLMAEERYDDARQLLRRSLAGNAEAGLHVAHFEGVILIRQRRYDEAIGVFRSILSVEPDFTPSRMELARLLYRFGHTEAAGHHLEAVSTGSDDVAMRRLASDFLGRIGRERPYGFSGYVSVLPSTNINRGTDVRFFESALGVGTVGDESRRRSGVGVGAGASGYYRWDLGHGSGVILGGAADLKKFSGTRAFDELVLSTNVSYATNLGPVGLRIGPTVQYTLAAWKPYVWRYGVAMGAQMPLSDRTRLNASLAVLRQDYARLDHRNGWLATGSLGLRHALSESFSVGATLSVLSERTRRAHLDHDDYRVQLQADREWRGGLMTSAFAGYARHQYRGNFPAMNAARRDDRWNVGGLIAHRSLSFAGFAPRLRYEFVRQRSNVAFYDYSSHDVGVTLTRRF